jgi:predicted dehydrogenase
MQALVIGLGSIGLRHTTLLLQLGLQVSAVSRRGQAVNGLRIHPTLPAALAAGDYDYVVVANETSLHRQTLADLADANFAGSILVEKPLFERVNPLPGGLKAAVFVGYNLRFHPGIQALKGFLAGRQTVSARLYAGQDLRQWRPGCDVAASYSAQAALGGGVLRDLSHELDLACHLFGRWQRVIGEGGRFGTLEIDRDDTWNIMAEHQACNTVSIGLSYLDSTPCRRIAVTTTSGSATLDLISGELQTPDGTARHAADRDMTYLAQHKAILGGETSTACSLADGQTVTAMIDAVETSNKNRCWMTA